MAIFHCYVSSLEGIVCLFLSHVHMLELFVSRGIFFCDRWRKIQVFQNKQIRKGKSIMMYHDIYHI